VYVTGNVDDTGAIEAVMLSVLLTTPLIGPVTEAESTDTSGFSVANTTPTETNRTKQKVRSAVRVFIGLLLTTVLKSMKFEREFAMPVFYSKNR
jgi:hypothetical protein